MNKNILSFSLFVVVLLLGTPSHSLAQDAPFKVELESVEIDGLGGVQSYAFGQDDGKWLIIGGRMDGLHRRQPFASFDAAGNNRNIIVIDPEAKKFWTSSLGSLSTALQEQLSSTNTEFYQDGKMLYIAGGYGYSATSGDHITYPGLIAVNVPAVIESIIQGNLISSAFRSVSDQLMAVTGGRLLKLYNTYYLVGGQRFTGRYNPMGPNHGPGFTQEYTEEIRKFKINDDGTNLSITHIAQVSDPDNLHRRDYNVFPQIMPDGAHGLTAFSGVFQKDADLPFLNSVNIDTNGHEVAQGFVQRYNHYHCAGTPLYSEKDNDMHTVFFGGMAQYYDSSGVLIEDQEVPFVRSIARVTRNSSGTMTEHLLDAEMPALLGSGSEFLPVESLPAFDNGVIQLDELDDTTVIGYVYGGIESSAKNIFFINDGTQSEATNRIFKVKLIKGKRTGGIIESDPGTFNVLISPNPSKGRNSIRFTLNGSEDVELEIFDMQGRSIEQIQLGKCAVGTQEHKFRLRGTTPGRTYFILFRAGGRQHVQKMVMQ